MDGRFVARLGDEPISRGAFRDQARRRALSALSRAFSRSEFARSGFVEAPLTVLPASEADWQAAPADDAASDAAARRVLSRERVL